LGAFVPQRTCVVLGEVYGAFRDKFEGELEVRLHVDVLLGEFVYEVGGGDWTVAGDHCVVP